MKTITASGSFELVIAIGDDAPIDIFERAAEPDFPYKRWAGGSLSRAEVIEHLAHNAAVNGVTDISQLDGWADFPRGAVTLRVETFDIESPSRG